MTAAQQIQSLPVWIWLVFAIFIFGGIVLVYTQGNWRTTLKLTGSAIVIALLAAGLIAWDKYLGSHFIGQFDSLGIPFRKAGPGWSILLDAWPLWLVPMALTVVTVVLISWLIGGILPPPSSQQSSADVQQRTGMEFINPVQQVAKKMQLEEVRRDLLIAQDKLATNNDQMEKLADKNQDLEIKLMQWKEEQQDVVANLEDKVNALTLENEAQQAKNNELTALTLQQIEQIIRLKQTDSNHDNS